MSRYVNIDNTPTWLRVLSQSTHGFYKTRKRNSVEVGEAFHHSDVANHGG